MLHRKKHRWLYGLVAFVTAISINLATPTISQAGFFDNLLRGILIWGVQSYQLSNLSDADEENFGTQIHNCVNLLSQKPRNTVQAVLPPRPLA